MTTPGEFYEDDESMADVLAAWEAGESGETAPSPELASRAIYFDWTRGTGSPADLKPSGDAEYALFR